MQETSVIQLDGESKVALVFGQMNEPPGARARVALTGMYISSPTHNIHHYPDIHQYLVSISAQDPVLPNIHKCPISTETQNPPKHNIHQHPTTTTASIKPSTARLLTNYRVNGS